MFHKIMGDESAPRPWQKLDLPTKFDSGALHPAGHPVGLQPPFIGGQYPCLERYELSSKQEDTLITKKNWIVA